MATSIAYIYGVVCIYLSTELATSRNSSSSHAGAPFPHQAVAYEFSGHEK